MKLKAIFQNRRAISGTDDEYYKRLKEDSKYMLDHFESLIPKIIVECTFQCGRLAIDNDLCLPCQEALDVYLTEKLKEVIIMAENPEEDD